MIIKDFLNNNFIVLAYLYDQKTANNIVKTTQDEVAEYMGLSRVTVNKVFGVFIEHGYINKDTKHIGRYVLTDLGCKVVESIRCLSIEANVLRPNNYSTKKIYSKEN